MIYVSLKNLPKLRTDLEKIKWQGQSHSIRIMYLKNHVLS